MQDPDDTWAETGANGLEQDADDNVDHVGEVKIHHDPQLDERIFSWKKLWAYLGPGFLMCIAYVDPGNLESDLQTGVQTRYSLLWLVFWSTFMGFFIQMLAAKLGVVTRKNLAQQCREWYPRTPRIALWVMAEVAIIGSDIQEVIGSAIAIYLLSRERVPLYVGVLITAVDTYLFLLIERWGVRKLEFFFSFCVAVMCAMFGGLAFQAGIPAGPALKGFLLPTLTRSALRPANEMVGAIIMPHNLFLHSSLVQSRAVEGDNPKYKREAMFYFGIEGALTLLATVFINCCVVAVFAAKFYGTDHEVGLTGAGEKLGMAYGDAARILFALGLLAAGQSSTMTGTYTGQFVMSGFLNLKISPVKRILVTRLVAIVPTLLVCLLVDDSDVSLEADLTGRSSIDVLNEWLNLLQAVQLPFALLPLVHITSSKAIMGEFVNSTRTLVGMVVVSALLIFLNLITVGETIRNQADSPMLPLLVASFILYMFFLLYLAIGPTMWATLTQYFSEPRHGDAAEVRGAEQYRLVDYQGGPERHGIQLYESGELSLSAVSETTNGGGRQRPDSRQRGLGGGGGSESIGFIMEESRSGT